MMYDKYILNILTDVGMQGISVQLLAKHVYNQSRTLFFTPDLEDIRNYVQQYLLRNSKDPMSLIERMERRGYYRLNTNNNADARQLVITFRESVDVEQKEEKPKEDLSLNLFD